MPKYIPPYNFVRIKKKNVTDANSTEVDCGRKPPIGHDVFPQQDLISGRVQCTLHALTPLLAANEQKSDLANGHKLIKPFKFPEDGYGIADSSLKGMIANTYAAITHSPIERVNDRTFSFRPNLGLGHEGPRALAGILFRQGTVENPRWIVKSFLTYANDFKHEAGVDANIELWLARASEEFVADPEEWFKQCPNNREVVLRCPGGLDGAGILESLFNEKSENPRAESCKTQVLRIPRHELFRKPLPWLDVTQAVLNTYNDTTKHLCIDHLEDHPNLHGEGRRHEEGIKNSLMKSRELRSGTVVFLEESFKRSGTIISLGMNFRYRWRYRDSIKYRNKGPGEELREIFDIESEQAKPWNALNLSPRRRLFGFVDAGVKSGEGKVNAYAGRVRVSCATHIAGSGKEITDVPLKTLGSPKASSYEFYLEQDGADGLLRDYGDDANPGRTGEPAGRKFYLHQPQAAWDAARYTAEGTTPEEKRHNQNQTAAVLFAPDESKTGAARFPQFKFTVLFENLERWEFDRLLLAIGLGNAKDAASHLPATGALMDAKLYKGNTDLRAHKLGHGEPLGLGSALITLDAIEQLRVEEKDGLPYPKMEPLAWAPAEHAHELPEDLKAIAHFRPLDGNGVRVEYPKLKEKGEPTTPAFHSKVRQAQMSRRRGKQSYHPDEGALPPAEALRRAIDPASLQDPPPPRPQGAHRR